MEQQNQNQFDRWIPNRGDEVVNIERGFLRFKVTDRAIDERNGKIYIFNGDNEYYPLDHCISAEEHDRELTGEELTTLAQMAVIILDQRLAEEMKLFASLAPHQKRQFWLTLTDEQRSGLSALAAQSGVSNGRTIGQSQQGKGGGRKAA